MADTLDFLRSVWPDSGLYLIASPFRPAGSDKTVYAQKVFDTIEDAAHFARSKGATTDVFFATHSLHERRVWNPSKKNFKTGDPGAFEVRTHKNMWATRVLHLDLDVGTEATKFPSQVEALRDLKAFCETCALPKPTLVSSGSGIHVYWLLSDDADEDAWAPLASQLKRLTKSLDLKADPARTMDRSSVLRVPGTFNFKRGKQPVVVLQTGAVTPIDTLATLLREAGIRAGAQEPTALGLGLGPRPAPIDYGKTNLDKSFDGPPPTLRAVGTACKQIRQMLLAKGNVSEPEWYHLLNIVRFVEDGDRLVHKVSEGHPQYNAEATNAKVQQLRDKDIGPSTCDKLADVAGPAGCEGCPFLGRVRSPLVAARFRDEAPAPTVAVLVDDVTETLEVPDCPKPFSRLRDGGLSRVVTTAEGEERHVRFYDNDIYPLRRLVSAADEGGTTPVEQQMWRVMLPRSGAKDFVMDADALYDRRKFTAAVSNCGIYPDPQHIPDLQEYMVAYIRRLQQLADAETAHAHLGWDETYTSFTLPDRVMSPGGKSKVAALSHSAASASENVQQVGSFEEQCDLMAFYADDKYLANQFFICAGFAAPIFYATGHSGVIINAAGVAGASKSSSLYTAASIWGRPDLYPLNGTNNGATARARDMRITSLANLPVCVDEITHMAPADAKDLAMGITQAGGRITLTPSRKERKQSKQAKATIMLTTANSSLHDLLSSNNSAGTAGSMRVIEIRFENPKVHQKYEADDFMRALKQHYGHLGPRFMRYVVDNRDAVEERIVEMVRYIDIRAEIQSGERFWSAAIAVVIVGCEIAASLNLVPYDPAKLLEWSIERQIPYMRGVVTNEYTSPIGVLADYMETINGDILITERTTIAGQVSTTVLKHPRGALLAHFDRSSRQMFVLKKPFKDHCNKLGWSATAVLGDLSTATTNALGRVKKVVPSPRIKKVLGAGTDLAKAQSWCFTVDMDHPEISGTVDVELASENGGVEQTPRRNNLRTV